MEILNSLEDWKEIDEYIGSVLPEWVVYTLNDYCDDYNWLKVNWEGMCSKFRTDKKKIIIVSKLSFKIESKEDFLINQISDYLTRKGYIIRRQGEFTPCKKCEKAIPCEEIYDLMKLKGAPVPKVWKNICTGCE